MVENLYIGKNPKSAVELIKKFNTNPDSSSGLLTQPKVISAGESVTIPAGRIAVLPNVQVDGEIVVEAGGEMFIPAGSTVDMGNGLAINGEKIVMSVPTSYHLLQGNLAVDNTVVTQGFNTTLYTGNGSTQSINTGIDMDTQWGDTAEEKFGGLNWIKTRSSSADHILSDSVNNGFFIRSNTTRENTSTSGQITRTSTGITFGSDGGWNANATNYVSWNFQTTHRISGVTNHGKPYTCHYNPFTGFTIVKYEGSGLVGHEIPHHLGRKLGFWATKVLNAANDWTAQRQPNYGLNLNTANAEGATSTWVIDCNDMNQVYSTHTMVNGSANQYIMYGWANSYFDEANKLIGNYEVGVYQGTGAAGNKVKTRGKPAWVMIKRLDSTGNWIVTNNKTNTETQQLVANLSVIENDYTYDTIYNIDGFTLSNNNIEVNAAGGQYLYMVAYDTNSDGGGSYYPKSTDTANVQINNALIPIAKGSDINGLKNVMLSKNEAITGLTYTAGKNYIYCDGNGSYGVKSVAPNYGVTNPINGGDFYNVLKNKWYTSADVEIPEGRNYLNHIVHADNDGGVLYVEELPKIEYKDVIKANEYQGKNACTAWVNFDLSTTPPTIKESYNISSVIRTSTGKARLYFEDNMDKLGYVVTGSAGISADAPSDRHVGTFPSSLGYCDIQIYTTTSTMENPPYVGVYITGGKN